MNNNIKEQLKKITVAQLPEYDDCTTDLHIPKKEEIKVSVCLNSCYMIMLENYILFPPSDFTLHTNWNKGVVPKSKYYKCQVTNIMGNMIKITGVGYNFITQSDTSDNWEGWLPSKSFTVIKEL